MKKFVIFFTAAAVLAQSAVAVPLVRGTSQLALGSDWRARSTGNTQVVATSKTVTVGGVAVEEPARDFRAEFVEYWVRYKEALLDAGNVCKAATGSVDDTIRELGGLLGSGIGQLVGGGVGAGAGTANVIFTYQTAKDEKTIESLTEDIAKLKKQIDELPEDGYDKETAKDELAKMREDCKDEANNRYSGR